MSSVVTAPGPSIKSMHGVKADDALTEALVDDLLLQQSGKENESMSRSMTRVRDDADRAHPPP